MIEIPDPPMATFCASCGHSLVHLWSPRRQSWVTFVSAADHTLSVHPCRIPGSPLSWRDVPRRSEPTAEYVAAKAALGEKRTS